MYDYLIVGAGLYGAVCANELKQRGKKVVVIDKRLHIAGNLFTEEIEGITVHKYGPHIFHTSNEEVWKYINKFAEFNSYIHQPLAKYGDEYYNLPFNMHTFAKIWKDVVTPEDAKRKIEEEKLEFSAVANPQNLEERAISLVGKTLYDKLIKGYTVKQWGRLCVDLPSFIIERIPVRYAYNNNYFNDTYQGIPIGGYTKIIEKMLEGVDVYLGVDFINDKNYYMSKAKKIIYTGAVDEFFNYKYGELAYRSLRFEENILDIDSYQGAAVINYCEESIPYTRVIEHKFFCENLCLHKTVVTKEFPISWQRGAEPYYPVNDEYNNKLYLRYMDEAKTLKNVFFGGRLGKYRYYNMDQIIEIAINDIVKIDGSY